MPKADHPAKQDPNVVAETVFGAKPAARTRKLEGLRASQTETQRDALARDTTPLVLRRVRACHCQADLTSTTVREERSRVL